MKKKPFASKTHKFFSIILVLSLLLSILSRSNVSNVQAQETSNDLRSQSLDWVTYTSSTYGYQLEYPSFMEPVEYVKRGSLSNGVPSDLWFGQTMHVIVRIPAFEDEFISRIWSSAKTVNLADVSALRMEGTISSDIADKNSIIIEYLIRGFGADYIITYEANDAGSTIELAQRQLFESTANSFKMLPSSTYAAPGQVQALAANADSFDFFVDKPDGGTRAPSYASYNANNQFLTSTSTCYNKSYSQLQHTAEDWFRAPGTPVYAIANGRVIYTHPQASYPGNVIIIEHTLGNSWTNPWGGNIIYSVYAHVVAEATQWSDVTKGQRIATVMDYPGEGNNHIHFELRRYGDMTSILKCPTTNVGSWPGPGYTNTGDHPDNYGYTNPSAWIDGHRSGGGSCDATSLPSGYTKCADENGNCGFSGTKQVYYGANSCFAVRSFSNGVTCSNNNFGDPVPNTPKACYIQSNPPNCPQDGGVILYWNANYNCSNDRGDQGYRQRTSTGLQNMNDGSFNDQASSIKIPSGWSVRLFNDADGFGGGGSVCFTSSISDFGTQGNFPGTNTAINDHVSSIKVYDNNNCSEGAPPNAPVPSGPANGQFFNEGESINLSWSATGNEYYGEVWGGPAGTTYFDWQAGTSKNIGSQWAGYVYTWHVKARNGFGESGWSFAPTFVVRPSAATNLSASVVSCSQINLSWSDNSGNEEGYKIYRNGNLVATLGSGVTSYLNTGLGANTTYSYVVRAYRGNIESNDSNTASATTSTCPTPPSPPSALGATKGSYADKVVLTWNGSAGATRYEIWRSLNRVTEPAVRIADNVTATTYNDITAIQGAMYYYWVKACNAAGCSNLSTADFGYRPRNSTSFNLLMNPGFEEGTDVPGWWRKDAWDLSKSSFVWGADQAHAGTKSIAIGNNSNNDARWLQTVAVQPNANYLLSGWIKTQIVSNSPDANNVGANLSVMGGFEHTRPLLGNNDWTYVSLLFYSGSRTQVDIGARLGMYSGTTIGIGWYDDLKLEILSTPTCYTLTRSINPAGSGSISVNPAPNCNNGTQYIHGTTVILTAAPGTGFSFGSWSGALSGSTNPSYVRMDAAKSLTASFTAISPCYSLVRTHTGNGADPVASPANSSGCASGNYHAGELITLTASPASGYRVGSWSATNDDASTSLTNTLTMPAQTRGIAVNYVPISYLLSVSKSGNGAGTVTSSPAGINCGSDCSETYNHGTLVTLTASPAADSSFTGWSGGGCSGTGACTVTMTGAATVTASFVGNPPGAFSKSSPANGATNQPLSFNLTWASSPGATSYAYCYDTTNDNDCSNWTANSIYTSKTISGLAPNTTYYWHVRAFNNYGVAFSNGSTAAFWSFTTASAPGAFSKSSPTDGVTNQPLSLTLTWAPSADATSYAYCYDTTNDNDCTNWTANSIYTSKTISGLAPNTTYYWHVRAFNNYGVAFSNGSPTSFWSFRTGDGRPGPFSKTSPANSVINQPLSITLTWASSLGATSYAYCYDTTNDNDCTNWTANSIYTSKTISGLAPNTTYYWHVRAFNNYGVAFSNGSTAAFWSFRTGDAKPGPFSKSSPANGATNQPLSFNLTWAPSADATSYAYCYDTTNDNDCTNWTANSIYTSKTISGLAPNTTYYWHVRAFNNYGVAFSNGSTTAFWSFSTGSGAPGAFSKSSPANSAINQPLSVTLNWEVSPGATFYALCYDTTNDNTCSGWTALGNITSKALTGLNPNTTYYWHVRAFNALTSTFANGSSSAYWSFSTGSGAPGAFSKSSPANSAINQPLSLTLSWQPSPGATFYALCYDTTNDNTCSGWTAIGNVTSKALTGLSPNTTYYWHIRAFNTLSSTFSNGSSTTYWSFSTGSAVTAPSSATKDEDRLPAWKDPR